MSYILRIGSRPGDQVVFPIQIGGLGRVTVSVTWPGTANNLTVNLDRSGWPYCYQPVTRSNPLALNCDISISNFSRVR
ncbi:MAG: hypothetical protein HYR94_09585 [Chloroflexi bacterium]|nr:hypothetical protein [Chloroflexota bacterium]